MTSPHDNSNCIFVDELMTLSNSLKIGKGDVWVRSILLHNEDEMCFEFHRPLSSYQELDLHAQFEHMLMPPAIMSVYFPKSANDKPFCFCEDGNEGNIDHHFISKVSEAAEHANEVLILVLLFSLFCLHLVK